MSLLRTRSVTPLALTLCLGLLLGCQSGPQDGPATDSESMSEGNAAIDSAVAVIQPTEGNNATGTVLFSRSGDGIRIQARLEGLGEGPHGFHIHEYGDCTAADGTSAGGHFNPLGSPHAGPTSAQRHVGDLGNINANADGVATYSRVDTVISFSGPAHILGRGMVVHQGEDDMSSQPSGAAGPRVGCGVIGVANPATSVSPSG